MTNSLLDFICNHELFDNALLNFEHLCPVRSILRIWFHYDLLHFSFFNKCNKVARTMLRNLKVNSDNNSLFFSEFHLRSGGSNPFRLKQNFDYY